MHITFKNEDLGDFGNLKLQEARLIKRELGMLPQDFDEALEKGDPDAACMLVAIMLTRRTGEPVSMDDIDGELTDINVKPTAEELAKLSPEKRKRYEDALAEMSPGKEDANESSGNEPGGSSGNDRLSFSKTSTEPSPSTPPDSGVTSA